MSELYVLSEKPIRNFGHGAHESSISEFFASCRERTVGGDLRASYPDVRNHRRRSFAFPASPSPGGNVVSSQFMQLALRKCPIHYGQSAFSVAGTPMLVSESPADLMLERSEIQICIALDRQNRSVSVISRQSSSPFQSWLDFLFSLITGPMNSMTFGS